MFYGNDFLKVAYHTLHFLVSYSTLIHSLAQTQFNCVVSYSMYSTEPSRAPFRIFTCLIIIVYKIHQGFISVIYMSTLHATFHIYSIDTIRTEIHCTKFLKIFNSTPLQRPSKLVLQTKEISVNLISHPFRSSISIRSFLRSLQIYKLPFSFS